MLSEKVPTSAHTQWWIGMNHLQTNCFGDSVIVVSSVSHWLTKASFIPLSRISARYIDLETTHTFSYGEDVILVCIPN